MSLEKSPIGLHRWRLKKQRKEGWKQSERGKCVKTRVSCSNRRMLSVLVGLGTVQNLKLLSRRPHVEGDLFMSLPRSSPCKWRHLRAVRYMIVAQQCGTGSGCPAANWTSDLVWSCVPAWDVARAQGPSSVLQQEVPWSPQEAPQSLLREALPCRSSSTGSDKGDVSLPSDFAPLEKEARVGMGMQWGSVWGMVSVTVFRRQLFVVLTSPASSRYKAAGSDPAAGLLRACMHSFIHSLPPSQIGW